MYGYTLVTQQVKKGKRWKRVKTWMARYLPTDNEVIDLLEKECRRLRHENRALKQNGSVLVVRQL